MILGGAALAEVALAEAPAGGQAGRAVGFVGRHRLRHQYTEEDFKSQRPFTRQLWEETLRAEEKARERAAELEAQGKAKQAEALEVAVDASEDALHGAVLYDVGRQLRELKAALVAAEKVGATLTQMHLAELKAHALKKRVEEMIRDEDDEIMLLLNG